MPEYQQTQFPVVRDTDVQGALTIENPHLVREMDLTRCVVSLTVNEQGQLWLDVNGISLLRFKPASKS